MCNLYNKFKKWLIIDEGACPIFKRIEIEKSEEIRKITFSQDEQLGIYILIKKNYLVHQFSIIIYVMISFLCANIYIL